MVSQFAWKNQHSRTSFGCRCAAANAKQTTSLRRTFQFSTLQALASGGLEHGTAGTCILQHKPYPACKLATRRVTTTVSGLVRQLIFVSTYAWPHWSGLFSPYFAQTLQWSGAAGLQVGHSHAFIGQKAPSVAGSGVSFHVPGILSLQEFAKSAMSCA